MSAVVLPSPIDKAVAAVNSGDADAFLAQFVADGVVDDLGSRCTLRNWLECEVIGVEQTWTPTRVDGEGERISIVANVGGCGFNGPTRFNFALADGKIKELEITATQTLAEAGPHELLRVELSHVELEDALAAYCAGTWNHGYMNVGRGSATIYPIAGTSRYQTVLARVARTPRPWRHPFDKHIPAVVRSDRDDAVQVLIDGMMVSYLHADAVRQVRPLVDRLATTGQSLVASALLVGGPDSTLLGGSAGKSYGVRVQIRPGAARRWAKGTKPYDVP
ncbi:hypothetical protein IU459_23170 [Nocardia amamiensis]|uniref:SnoaL-like domain-containing protein n=1 Tax=Nocardia amamiensis TaxID=404578 RepID=A0ABS0CUZ1_9NOCA|nr:nuclear transport factor 2 family protein [Nocardia amamiensis]MBF6300424.1 hypothetical protein [Nocardia amamiensis]